MTDNFFPAAEIEGKKKAKLKSLAKLKQLSKFIIFFEIVWFD